MRRLTLVRRIAARPSIVFEAMTTVEGVAVWWGCGPDEVPIVSAEIDARVGGRYRVQFRTLDGSEHEACGEYLELVPPCRIVMSWRWAFGGVPDEHGRTSRIEIDLAPVADGTELVFTHAELWSEASEHSHSWGWTGSLDRLVRHLERAGEGVDREQAVPG
ncbi:MAG TPA: SRPBCC domain-containing protein [Kofleriaceae bacterium]|nr:SRPBCC domain-containing protein [Kofleriaceae bacterium]